MAEGKERYRTRNHKCLQCGESFYAAPSTINNGGGKYCSRKCFNLSRRVKKACLICGKIICVKPSSTQKYCSSLCANSIMKANPRKLTIKKCLYCQNEFASKGKYCSRTCANISLSETRPKTVTILVCPVCGSEFARRPSDIKRGARYCSKKCRGIAAIGVNSPAWRGGPFYSFGLNWKQQQKLAYERDGGVCQHCGLTEAQSLKKYGKRNAIHHIEKRRAFRERGEPIENSSVLTNLICLCASCHKRAEFSKIILQPKLL